MLNTFQSIRPVDKAAVAASPPEARYTQELIGAGFGSETCQINYIVTPPGGGSPEGLHNHVADQCFYVLAGVMQVEIEGVVSAVPAGSLVVFPKGVPHRNWNEGSEPTTHLAINTPAPDPSVPFGRPV